MMSGETGDVLAWDVVLVIRRGRAPGLRDVVDKASPSS